MVAFLSDQLHVFLFINLLITQRRENFLLTGLCSSSAKSVSHDTDSRFFAPNPSLYFVPTAACTSFLSNNSRTPFVLVFDKLFNISLSHFNFFFIYYCCLCNKYHS